MSQTFFENVGFDKWRNFLKMLDWKFTPTKNLLWICALWNFKKIILPEVVEKFFWKKVQEIFLHSWFFQGHFQLWKIFSWNSLALANRSFLSFRKLFFLNGAPEPFLGSFWSKYFYLEVSGCESFVIFF